MVATLVASLAAPTVSLAQEEPAPAEDFSLSGWSEDHLTWSGYYENQFTFQGLPGTETPSDLDFLDYNKVRLELSARPTPGFSANVNLVVRTYHGTTTYDLADYLPDDFDDELALLATFDPTLTTFQLQDEIFLNDAYLTAGRGDIRWRIGKQQIRFGSGYLWNPTDPFTVIDLLDPSYEKLGVTAAKVQVFMPNEGLLEAYAVPKSNLADFTLGDTGLAFRARKAAGQWVFAASYAGFVDLAGLDITSFDPQVYTRRHLLGLEVTGEVGGVGVWAEGAYNRMDADWDDLEPIGKADWGEVLVGASYTFRNGPTVMAEGLYNGRGAEESGDYTLWHWLAYLDQTLRYLGRYYGTATVQYPIHRLNMTGSLTTIVNIGDPSLLVTPSFRYTWNEYLSVDAYAAFTWGKEDTAEFASLGQAGYLRMRLSF
jgi:hypothetical protein